MFWNVSKMAVSWDVKLRQGTWESASQYNWTPASHPRKWPCSGMCPKWPLSGMWRCVKVLGNQRHSVIGHQRHIPDDYFLECALDYHLLCCDAASLCDCRPAPHVSRTKTSTIGYASLKIRKVVCICVISYGVLQLSLVLCTLLYAQADAFVAAFDCDDKEKEVEEG